MNFFKTLSTDYFTEAKQLGYKWIDLVRKVSRQNVIDSIIRNRLKNTKSFIREQRALLKRSKREREENIRKVNDMFPTVTQRQIAFKGYTRSYNVEVIDNKDPALSQLNKTRVTVGPTGKT